MRRRRLISLLALALVLILGGLTLAAKTYSQFYVPFCFGVISFGVGLLIIVVMPINNHG